MIILDGKKVAEIETINLKQKVLNLKIKPKLGIIQVGNLPESNKYISNKINKAKEIGIIADWIKLDNQISEEQLRFEINKIKNEYNGLIVQLPLPNHINSQNILDLIDLDKDIDGLSSKNQNNFYNDVQPYFCPATARAVLLLLNFYNIDLNKKIMVIGESNLVGKPTKKLLSRYSNNVVSRNKQIGISGSEEYDILVVATGNPNLIKKENIKEGAIIVDVGINVLENNKLVGDVDFESVSKKAQAISPVPGGVGPLTVICLLKNLIDKF